MDEQFFTSLFLIIGIDLILGGDNAIVIALACRNLPENQRRKGILFGTMLAILSRILLTLLAVHLLNIPFLICKIYNNGIGRYGGSLRASFTVHCMAFYDLCI